jgi:hypothetical protein
MSTPYGTLGALARDGEFVQCHLCGRWFSDLEGPHLMTLHGLSAPEYREAVGLNRQTALMGPTRAATRSAVALAKVNREGLRVDLALVRPAHPGRPRRMEGRTNHRRGWRNGTARAPT